MKLLIKNGIVFTQNLLMQLDVAVAEGKILAIGGKPSAFVPDQIIDADGAYVLPGFIDMHTHLDDIIGNYELADAYRSGTEVAVRNGITTVFNFVTQRDNETLDNALQKAHKKAGGNCWSNYGFHLTPTRFLEEDWTSILQKVEQGYKTFKFYTTYKNAGLYCSYEQLENIIDRLSLAGARCLVHCEDEDILSSVSTEGIDYSQPYSHALLRPPKAETEAVMKLIELSMNFNARIHIVHVSTYLAVQMIQKAREEAPITCETAPQYLFLNEDMLKRADGHRWMCSPPLRSEEERLRMIDAARNGMFDVVATDHCAFRKTDKDNWNSDIGNVPNGIAGIGALPHLVASLYDGDFSKVVPNLVNMLSKNPARITGLYPRKGMLAVGADADIVVMSPATSKRPIVSSFSDTYETYPDRFAALDFRSVIVGGKEVVRDNKLIPSRLPEGECVCQP